MSEAALAASLTSWQQPAMPRTIETTEGARGLRAVIRGLAPAVALAPLAACAAAGGSHAYPSLAPRAAETHGFEEPAPPPPTPVRSDPALDGRIAAAAGQADERGRAFAAARGRAEAKVAAAARAPAGSEAWLDAQVALGELDIARSEASEAVTTLEALAADRAVAGEPPYPALEEALAAARARQDEAAAAIAALNARLSR